MAITVEQAAAARRSAGLPPDPASDLIWANRSWATLQNVTARLREVRAQEDANAAATGGTYLGAPRGYVAPSPGITPGNPLSGESTNAHEDGAAQAAAEAARPNPTPAPAVAPVAPAEEAPAGGAPAGGEEGAAGPTGPELPSHATMKAVMAGMGLPQGLLDEFITLWTQEGDPNLAVALLRQGPNYDTYLPGNRRDDGSLRHDEQTYFSIIEGYEATVAGRGLDPQLFASAGTWVSGIENGWSVMEFEAGVSGLEDSIFQRGDEIIEAFSQASGGIAFTREAALTAMIDENLGNELFQRKISIAQVRGTATKFGYGRSLGRGDELHNAGVTERSATDFYSQANKSLSFLDPAAKRFGEQDDTFDVGELEDASLLSDPLERARMQRLVARGYGEFGRASSFAGEGNRLTGLRDR